MNQISQILGEVKKAVVGKDRVLVWVMTVILARGHILLEDIPGVGKTTMALAFAKALGLEYGRVQFTPDVLPSDITGYSIYNKETGAMRYQPGAIVCNIFLADELNRATSRTQSALLEAMEEGQVTVDGVSHRIPQPFIVFATQNPTGAADAAAGQTACACASRFRRRRVFSMNVFPFDASVNIFCENAEIYLDIFAFISIIILAF